MSSFLHTDALHHIEKHLDRFPLIKLDRILDWTPIEQYLTGRKTRYVRDNGGRPAYPLLSMFKAILLGQWHSLSDPELEYSLITRIDFQLETFAKPHANKQPEYDEACSGCLLAWGFAKVSTYGSEVMNGIETFISSGGSASDGHSPKPSVTHRNGQACDFRYLAKDHKHIIHRVYTNSPVFFDLELNTQLVKIFKRFGMIDFYTGTQPTKKEGGVAAIVGTKFAINHHHHLHVGVHNGKFKDI